MREILFIIAVSAFGATLLSMFYSIVKARWPESYFTTRQLVDYTISHNWMKFVGFRSIPPYAIGLLVGSLAIRLDISLAWTLLTCGLMHIMTTTVRASVLDWRYKSVRSRLLLANFSVTVFVGSTFVVAYFTARPLFRFIPGPDKYIEVVATGAVAAAFMYYLHQLTSQHVDVDMVVKRFREWVPDELESHIDNTCIKYRVDYDLAMSIIVTEWAQRPGWIRHVERLAGQFGLSKTFGLMQSSNTRSATDIESITIGVQNLAGAVLPRQYGGAFRHSLAEYYLEKHNRGSEFAQFALSVLSANPSGFAYQGSYVANDGRPGLRANDPVRNGDVWTIEGDVCTEVERLRVRTTPREVHYELNVEDTESTRKRWSIELPLYVESIRMVGSGDLPSRPSEPDDCSIEINFY